MERLVRYPWPGNIRELQNVIERALVLATGPVLRLGPDLQPAEPMGVESAPTVPDEDTQVMTLDEVERRHIEAVLMRTAGVVAGPEGAARILDVHPNTLRSRMKKLGVSGARHQMS